MGASRWRKFPTSAPKYISGSSIWIGTGSSRRTNGRCTSPPWRPKTGCWLCGRGDRTSGLVWKYQRAVPQLPTVLLYQNVLYMLSDAGVLTTLDPTTGAMHRQARLRGVADRYFSSPVAGDGKVFITSQTGIVTVLKAGSGQEVLAANELDDECYATPAIADGRIYIRTRSALYCFGKRD